MTYALLNTVVLLLVATAALLLASRTPRDVRVRTRTLVTTIAVIVVMTAVFDNLMIAVGLVGYDPERISGMMVGIAPIEDFAYSVAAGLLIPTLWQYFASRKARA